MHRQLSWAFQKEIQMFEKETKVTTNNLERSKTAMQGRFRELNNVRKNLRKNTPDLMSRRRSCPAVLDESNLKSLSLSRNDLKNTKPHADDGNDDVFDDSQEAKEKYFKLMPRSVSMYGKAISADDEILSSAKQSKGNQTARVNFERRQTMPTL
jgi:hypothetical protein